MFYHFRRYFLIFNLLLCVDSENRIRVKRNDIDLSTCIDKFNIHSDKIIRTQDSQNMGAKYLNELDIGSREECLHLCCETNNCDVFVFEEKKAGSCYLFQCGPPEDFKCKFTHHANYSSAILSINRHLPDLESQIKLTKHEQDLNKLRKPEQQLETTDNVVSEIKVTSYTTTTTTTTPVREIVPVSKNAKISEEDTECTRFQFECRSTKECIAIYNACDGIPQCADGSDEGAELGCPESVVTTATNLPLRVNNAPMQPLLQVRYDANVQQSQLPQIPLNQQTIYLQQPRDSPQLISTSIQRNPETTNVMRAGNNVNVNPRLQFDSPIQAYIPQLPVVQAEPNWIIHQSNQMPPQIPQYNDKASRIFNHKESGFQVPSGQDISQVPLPYAKMGNYYPENSYRQPVHQKNWPSDEVYQQASSSDRAEINPQHVQEQLAHDLKYSKDNMDHVYVDSSKVKVTNILQEEQYPDVVAYKLSGANDLEDGIAHTQKGAVLSVSLGLIITFIMAVLIGCRLKVVRKRMRKGGKSYAHDADFLVNGMYL